MAKPLCSVWRALAIVCRWALCLSLLAGCQQKMAEQPSYRPLVASRFFPDGRSARPLTPGTVAQGSLHEVSMLFTGRTTTSSARTSTIIDSSAAVPALNPPTESLPDRASLGGKPVDDYSTQFPFSITREELARGQERFTIFCAVCHGSTGRGDGAVVQRGYTKPPSYITENSRGLQRRGIQISLRDVPVGYLFEVISKGYGAMADYSTQVSVHERWDIVAYIRALQISQRVPLNDLPSSQQDAARRALEATP